MKRYIDRLPSEEVQSARVVTLSQVITELLYPRHTKYVGVYSFRLSVRPFVRSYVRLFVRSSFSHRVKVFALKFIKTSYFEDPLMDFIHI